jgi:hypothetical protein
MKRFLGFAILLVLVAVPAFAGGKTQKVSIGTPVQVGSTKVAPGEYDLTYTGTGSNVQVTLTKNQKAVVTFPATAVVENSMPGMETSEQGGVARLQVLHLNKISFTVAGAPQSGQ